MLHFKMLTTQKSLAKAIATALSMTPFLLGCGDSGGSGSNIVLNDEEPVAEEPVPEEPIPEEPVPTQFSISAVGGATAGSESYGGSGGYVMLGKDDGTGNLEILRNGQASVTIDVTEPTMDFGGNKLTISSDATVVGASSVSGEYDYYIFENTLLSSGTDEPAGTGTLYINYGTIYEYDGDTSDDTAFTGIEVASGATLTFGLNDGANAALLLDNDIYNQGTITVADADGYRGSFSLQANNYFGAQTSRIATSGDADAKDAGSIYVALAGGFYNSGSLDAYGFTVSSGDGGAANYINIETAGGPAINSGTVNVSGGSDSGGGYGGSANEFRLYGYDAINTGEIIAEGGDGGYGGAGGGVNIEAGANYEGDGGVAYNGGKLALAGGTGTIGNGGGGGSFGLYGYGGDIVNNADIDARGGSGTEGAGNSGGSVNVQGSPDGNATVGNVLISGNINLDGGPVIGTSGDAGYGGEISIEFYTGGSPDQQRLALLGYTDINLDGGDAPGNPGMGGAIELYGYYGAVNVVNEANILARGGDSQTEGAQGGQGGYFYAETYTETEFTGGLGIGNGGTIDVSGGAKGYGGSVEMYAVGSLTNTAALTADGGMDLADYGGDGGYIDLVSYADVTNSARLSASGGAGGTTGGYAGHIYIGSDSNGAVTTSGGSYADGGDASGVEGTGGNGGYIEYFSSDSERGTTYSDALSVSGGSGTTAGTEGCAWVDGEAAGGNCDVIM